MPFLTAFERHVASMPGIPASQVAHATRSTIEAVRAARNRLGRDIETGLPRQHRRREPPSLLSDDEREVFFDALMRANRGLCP